MGGGTGVRNSYWIPGIFFGLYVLHVVAGKVQVLLWGDTPFHIGEVGEFILLLLTAVGFVQAAIRAEKSAATPEAE